MTGDETWTDDHESALLELLGLLEPVIQRAVSAAVRTSGYLMEAQDLRSECVLLVVERVAKFWEITQVETWERVAGKAFKNHLSDYVRKEIAHRYPDFARYSVGSIEDGLRLYFDTESYGQSGSSWPTGQVTRSPAAERGTSMAVIGDMSSALKRLRNEDRVILWYAYAENESDAWIAAELGITQEAARKRRTRAVDRIRDFLSNPAGNGALAGLHAAAMTVQDAA